MYDNDFALEKEKSLSINMPGMMKDVYAWMAIALVVTGFTAYTVADYPIIQSIFMGGRFRIIFLMMATFALVWHLNTSIRTMGLKKAAVMFLVYSVLNGITLSSIFLVYTMSSIANAFFLTAGMFGIMSVYGYVTKSDLSKVGNLCLMGLVGLILATLISFFFATPFFEMLISYAGVLIFMGLTVYDTNKIKKLALTYHSRATDEGQKLAILGALMLYLDFINLFLYLLRIFADRK